MSLFVFMKKKGFIYSLLFVCFLLIVSCPTPESGGGGGDGGSGGGGGGEEEVPTPIPQFSKDIQGFVTTSRGGPPVVGSTITLTILDETGTETGEPVTTTTNASGHFSFGNANNHFPLGTHNGAFAVEARKTGRASSRAVVNINKPTATVPVIAMQQFPIVVTSRSVVPPRITITGITNKETLTGTKTVTASVTGSNGFDIARSRRPLSVSIGSVGSGTYTYTSTTTSLTHPLNRTNLNLGDTFLEYVSYDNNNNQAIYILSVNNASVETRQFATTDIPAVSTRTRVSIVVTTVGEDIGTYAINQDTGIYVNIHVRDPYGMGGVLIHRGTSSTNALFIGSSSKRTKDADGKNVFEYKDYFPTLTEGSLYYYTFQYFTTWGFKNETYVYSKSRAVPVPFFPRLTSTLNAPAADTVYASNPNTITFSWDVTYPISVFSRSGMHQSSLRRTDNLVVREVGTHKLVDSRNIYVNIASASGRGSGTQTLTLDVGALSGKSYYWTVTTEMSYAIAYGTTAQTYYKVTSKAYPTVSLSPNNKGASHGGIRYFTIK